MFMLYNVDLHLCAAAANRIMLVGFAKGKMIPKQHKTLTRIVVDTKVIRCLTSTRSKWNTYGGAHMPIYSGLIHVASAWIVASHVLRGGCFQRGIPSSVTGLAATWQSQRTSKHVVRLLDRCKAQCSSMFCYLFFGNYLYCGCIPCLYLYVAHVCSNMHAEDDAHHHRKGHRPSHSHNAPSDPKRSSAWCWASRTTQLHSLWHIIDLSTYIYCLVPSSYAVLMTN